ncbi:MAG: hypothetical protein ABH950_00005, partial [Candidatus Altiarchaeota archaeon]
VSGKEYWPIANCSTTNESNIELEGERYYYNTDGIIRVQKSDLSLTSDVGFKCWDINVTRFDGPQFNTVMTSLPINFSSFRWGRWGLPQYILDPVRELRIREGSCDQNQETDPPGTFRYRPDVRGQIPFQIAKTNSVCEDMDTMYNCSKLGVILEYNVPEMHYINLSYYWDYPSAEPPNYEPIFDLYDDYSKAVCDCKITGTGLTGPYCILGGWRTCNSSMVNRIPIQYYNLVPIGDDAWYYCGTSFGDALCGSYSNRYPCGLYIRAHGKRWQAVVTNGSFDNQRGIVSTWVDNSRYSKCPGADGAKWGIMLNANQYDEPNNYWSFLLAYLDVANDYAGFRYVETENPNPHNNPYGLRMDNLSDPVSTSMCNNNPGEDGYVNLSVEKWFDVEWYIPENPGEDCMLWVNDNLTCKGDCLQYVGNPLYHQATSGPIGYFVKGAYYRRGACSTTCYCSDSGGCQQGTNTLKHTGTEAIFRNLILYSNDGTVVNEQMYQAPAGNDVNLSVAVSLPPYWYYTYPKNISPEFYSLTMTGEGYNPGVCDRDLGVPDDWMAISPGLAVRE